jgi:hypothetical protein
MFRGYDNTFLAPPIDETRYWEEEDETTPLEDDYEDYFPETGDTND